MDVTAYLTKPLDVVEFMRVFDAAMSSRIVA
jgi:hypothetical protein